MNYLPHTTEDIKIMLDRIGVADLADLFLDIPPDQRFPQLDLPPSLSEPEAAAHLRSLAKQNRNSLDGPWFLGGGLYNHFIPAVVGALTSRGEFATAYTPYQPEVSQGTLQALFEYQSMLSELLGLPAVNASHYDGATALAEAIMMAFHAAGGSNAPTPARVLIPESLNPGYRAVIDTYLTGTKITLIEYAGHPFSAISQASQPIAALVVQSPDFLGNVWELDGLAGAIHERGGLLIVHTDPIMAGIFHAPGSQGADIISAEGQALGIPMSFGGPSLGIMACTQALVRRLPGRLVGQAFDAKGRRGFALTLSAREQHIRREKAVSNICSNQGLMALSACVYLATMGPQGLRQVAELCWNRSHMAAEKIAAIPGFSVPALSNEPGYSSIFFKEFLVRTPIHAEELISTIRENTGIEAGLPLSRILRPGKRTDADRELLICATEMNDLQQIDALTTALAAYSGRTA